MGYLAADVSARRGAGRLHWLFREGSTFRTLDGILGAKQRRLLVKERQLVSGHYSQSARKAWELQARSCKLQVCKQSSEYC